VLILRKICKGLLGKPYSEMYSESLKELFSVLMVLLLASSGIFFYVFTVAKEGNK
jgi:hypothetical protein